MCVYVTEITAKRSNTGDIYDTLYNARVPRYLGDLTDSRVVINTNRKSVFSLFTQASHHNCWQIEQQVYCQNLRSDKNSDTLNYQEITSLINSIIMSELEKNFNIFLLTTEKKSLILAFLRK